MKARIAFVCVLFCAASLAGCKTEYTTDDMSTAIFTIEDGQITYSAFDEE